MDWRAALLVLVVLCLLSGTTTVATAQVDSITSGCCVPMKDYFQMRDTLVVQLADARADYKFLRDSIDAAARAQRKPKFQIDLTTGPGVFYDFSEGKVVSGLGIMIGLKLGSVRIF